MQRSPVVVCVCDQEACNAADGKDSEDQGFVSVEEGMVSLRRTLLLSTVLALLLFISSFWLREFVWLHLYPWFYS